MLHTEISPLAGKTIKIKPEIKHLQNPNFGGSDFIVEDWHDRLTGKSWMFCDGNPACIIYALRTGTSTFPVPTDNKVLYGKTLDGLGHLVHINEVILPDEAQG